MLLPALFLYVNGNGRAALKCGGQSRNNPCPKCEMMDRKAGKGKEAGLNT